MRLIHLSIWLIAILGFAYSDKEKGGHEHGHGSKEDDKKEKELDHFKGKALGLRKFFEHGLIERGLKEEVLERVKGKLQKLNTKVDEKVRKQHKDRKRPKLNEESGIHEYMYQGDMFLSEDQIDQILTEEGLRFRRQANKSPASLWKMPIAYRFDSTITPDVQQLIRETLSYYEKMTCARFREDATASPRLRYFKGPGCYSFVGVLNQTEQDVSIGDGCAIFSTVAHETAHALGVQHQQSRYDRDLYVYIDLSAINSAMAYNYDKYTSSQTENYGVLYDYGSVMHYAANSFAMSDDKPAMIANNHLFQNTMGSDEGPSFNDILLINTHYKCIEKCPANNCKNRGYSNPNDCAKCICPRGFSGNLCEDREVWDDCGESLPAFTMWKDLSFDSPANKTCIFHITSPSSSNVEIQILSAGRDCWFGCPYGAVEFKVANFTNTGFRICCPETTQDHSTIRTEANLAVIIAYSHYNVQPFQIKYRYVETGGLQPPTTPPTTPASTTTNAPVTAAPTTQATTRPLTTTLRPPTTPLPVVTTTQRPHVIPGEAMACEDSYPSCPFYLQQGGCLSTSYYYESMKEFCKKTCNFCGSGGALVRTTTTTTKAPYVTSAPSDCYDTYDGCSYYGDMGYCSATAEYRASMEAYCRKTCNFCNLPSHEQAHESTPPPRIHPANCVDMNNYCSHYASYGDCKEDSTYRQWMEDFCPLTCGFC